MKTIANGVLVVLLVVAVTSLLVLVNDYGKSVGFKLGVLEGLRSEPVEKEATEI